MLALYIQYSLVNVNIFSLQNLVDSTIQENATGIGTREEVRLLIENICDSQSKTETFQEKNNVTENSFFDLDDVIVDRKIVSELTHEGQYNYLTRHYCPKDQNLLHKKNVFKEENLKLNASAFADSKQTITCLQ